MGIVIFCDKCKHNYSSYYSPTRYVLDDGGNKVICGSHSIIETYQSVLGENYSEEKLNDRLGFDYPFICEKCCHEFQLDPEKDINICPKCESTTIKDIFEMIGSSCPFCKDGFVTSKSNFMTI